MKRMTGVIFSLILVAGIATDGTAQERAPRTEAIKHVTVLPDEMEWIDVASLPSGAKAAMIEGDISAAEPFTFRLMFPPNYEIPAHTHPTTERVTVLSGTLYLATGDDLTRGAAEPLPQGSVTAMPPGMKMYGYTTSEETVIQLNGIGPWGIEYLNPDEDPRNQ